MNARGWSMLTAWPAAGITAFFARGARQARRIAMAHHRALAAAGFQDLEALALEAVAGIERAFVPGLAGVVLLEARSGIDDQQRPHAFRMHAIKRQRHVAPE